MLNIEAFNFRNIPSVLRAGSSLFAGETELTCKLPERPKFILHCDHALYWYFEPQVMYILYSLPVTLCWTVLINLLSNKDYYYQVGGETGHPTTDPIWLQSIYLPIIFCEQKKRMATPH